ncbi:MAG: adenylate kinase [Rikenellaceae bacterium]|nr:adenylate kinase [Rikenellaceae bacterium]
MVNIVLFGAPGAGKGTQAERLVDKYGFSHISTGAVIREEIAGGTPLGRSMEEYIARGELAPDALVIGMVAEYMEKHRDGAGNIFDGFPRTVAQAEHFDVMMSNQGTPVDCMLSLEVPEELLIERILRRGKESGRADDSNVGVIRNRIEIYNRVTAVVGGYYKAQDKLIPVDGTGTVEEIFERICAIVDRYI